MNPVEEYIERKPNEDRPLWYHMRWLLLNAHPEMTEAVKWHLPFFTVRGKAWAYLNPIKDGSIDVSFMNGTLLDQWHHELRIDGRKRVGSIRIKNLETYNEETLVAVIQDSVQQLLNG